MIGGYVQSDGIDLALGGAFIVAAMFSLEWMTWKFTAWIRELGERHGDYCGCRQCIDGRRRSMRVFVRERWGQGEQGEQGKDGRS